MTDKPDCYKCIYRGDVPGSAHSCCRYPGNKTNIFEFFDEVNTKNRQKLGIKADLHGITHGWFFYPADFDPVWLIECRGFKEKQSRSAGKAF